MTHSMLGCINKAQFTIQRWKRDTGEGMDTYNKKVSTVSIYIAHSQKISDVLNYNAA